LLKALKKNKMIDHNQRIYLPCQWYFFGANY
jgi:hypothetical protein